MDDRWWSIGMYLAMQLDARCRTWSSYGENLPQSKEKFGAKVREVKWNDVASLRRCAEGVCDLQGRLDVFNNRKVAVSRVANQADFLGLLACWPRLL